MVSQSSTRTTQQRSDHLQRAIEEPFGEQYFPQQMSWYAAEGPQGVVESAGRWVRENPWMALGLGFVGGVALALATGSAAGRVMKKRECAGR